MAKLADTREYCRECGKATLHSIYETAPGLIIRKVICPECQQAITPEGHDAKLQSM